MTQKFIGAIVNADTGVIYAVINPDDDSELDNPRWLLLRTGETMPMRMVKMPRDEYMAARSMDEVAEIVARLES